MRKIDHPYQILKSEKREDIRILPFVENGIEYNYCFILLNPFYKRKNTIHNFHNEKPRWIDGPKSQILKEYNEFSWAEFIKYSKISDLKEIFHCLYFSDHNYVDRYQKVKRQVWESFQKTIEENQLLWSSDSYLSILLIERILLTFKNLGFENLALYDIFSEDIVFKKTSLLIESQIEFPNEFRLLTEDKKLLLYQQYEHYETFIYSNDLKLLESFLKLSDLEGFFANERTTLLWNEVEFQKNDEIIAVEMK